MGKTKSAVFPQCDELTCCTRRTGAARRSAHFLRFFLIFSRFFAVFFTFFARFCFDFHTVLPRFLHVLPGNHAGFGS